MKSSKILLVVWLLIVGLLAFTTVYILSQDPELPDGPGGEPGRTQEVPTGQDQNGETRDPRERDRVNRQPRRLSQSVTGRVVGPDGEPVPGATVRISLPLETTAPPETVRDEDIRFINDVIYIDPLEWDEPRPMTDWVRNMASAGAPRTGAEEIASTTTDSDGRFDLDFPRYVGIGPFRLSADSPVGRASAQGVRPEQDIELTVGPVATATGFVYSGGENTGVPGATVVLDDGETRFVGTTGPDGGFEVKGVSPGRYIVSAGAPEHPPLLGFVKVVKAGEPIDLRLPRGTTLVVKAIFEPDEAPERPLPGADVVVLEQDTYTYVIGKTDADGVVEFAGLPPGAYIVNGRGERAVSFGEELVDVSGNQLRQEVELSFEPAIDTLITVVDAAGQPIQGMVFYTANADEVYDALRSRRLPGKTDAQGRYSFAFEWEGPRALIYGFKEGFAMVRAYPDDHTDAIPMTLVAKPAIRVHGTVRTPEGQPIPDALVLLEVTPEDDDELEDYEIYIRTGPDGTYDFPHVPRGEIWLSAELGDDAWSDDYDVEPVEGKSDYRVDMEMELE